MTFAHLHRGNRMTVVGFYQLDATKLGISVVSKEFLYVHPQFTCQ